MYLTKFYEKTTSQGIVKYILSLFVLSFGSSAVAWFIILILKKLNIELDNTEKPLSQIPKGLGLFFIVCIITPLLETWVAQVLPISFFKRYFNTRTVVFFSAAIFGLMHWYSIAYMLNAFFMGLVLAGGYISWNKPHIIHPFWIICIVHGLRNLLAFILS